MAISRFYKFSLLLVFVLPCLANDGDDACKVREKYLRRLGITRQIPLSDSHQIRHASFKKLSECEQIADEGKLIALIQSMNIAAKETISLDLFDLYRLAVQKAIYSGYQSALNLVIKNAEQCILGKIIVRDPLIKYALKKSSKYLPEIKEYLK